ncbi:MAG: TonB-dependent receptor [Pelobium sp.]
MKKLITFALFIVFAQVLQAQTKLEVSGVVKDSTDVTVIGAAVKLTTATDTVNTVTNIDGIFNFSNVKSSEFSITVTALGFVPAKKRYLFDPTTNRQVLDPIILKNDSKMLGEVIVNGTPDVTVKEDTLQYRADAYKLRENALAEDLLKKLPGIEVDKDGNVTAQGKAITKVRINGKDYFGGDVKTATQQIPADLLQNVQIVDDYGDQANITGVRDGDPDKVLNFTIRKDKNKGYLARGVIGGGNEDRYQGSLFAASFNNNQQISLLANFNNTNANIFSLTAGAGGGGSGRGGFGGGNSDGLTGVNSIGLNYRDEWSPKVTAYGSYSFTDRNNTTVSSSLQEILTNGNTLNNNNFSNNNSGSNSHRFNFNVEYKIDSLNYLKVSPNLSFGNNNGLTNSTFNIQSQNSSSIGNSLNQTDYSNPNFGGDLLFNHRFGAKARNLSLNASFNSTSTDQNQDYIYQSTDNTLSGQVESYQRQLILGENKNDNVNLRFSYTEPITATKNLEFNYTYGFARAANNREVKNTDIDGGTPAFDPTQSNQYVFDYITNRFGLNYRVNEKKYNYTLGMSVQPATLTGTNTNRTITNIFPSARFSYKFSKTRELSFNYNGRSNQPSYNQLQPITDQSNAQFYVTGNPNLLPEFTNSASIRYNNFDFESGNVLFTNISYNYTQDKIVTNTITNPIANDPTVLQETRYTNTDGYYTLNGFYAFSKPFQEKKYVIGLRGSAIYNNNLSFIDNNKNTGKNLILSQRLNLQINPWKWLEFTPATTYTYTKNDNTLNVRANAEINSFSYSFDTKIFFLKSWIFGGTIDKTINNGYNSIGTNPLIINSYLEKQFFKGKKGSLKLQAYDLLDQSTSLSYIATGNTSTLSQSNRLARYFMLSFTFNISKFAGNSANNVPSMGGERRYRRDDN